MKWLVLIILLLIAPVTTAQTLPLQGYYRRGQYMAVRVEAYTPDGEITATGAAPTVYSNILNTRILPLLMLDDAASEVSIAGKSLPLQALNDNQKLIGVADAESSVGATLFPGKEILPVKLSWNDLRAAIPMSFDALDALILSSQAFAQLNPKIVDDLLACDVMIAVHRSTPPDAVRAWSSHGEYQLLGRDTDRAFTALPSERVYEPFVAWKPQRSAEARWLIVLVGGFCCVVFLALTVLPRRWVILSIAACSVLFTLLIIAASRLHGNRTFIATSVLPNGTQGESIHCFASLDDQQLRVPLPVVGYPVPYSQSHAADLKLQTLIDGENVSIVFSLNATRRLAILTRGGWKHDDAQPFP